METITLGNGKEVLFLTDKELQEYGLRTLEKSLHNGNHVESFETVRDSARRGYEIHVQRTERKGCENCSCSEADREACGA